MLVACLLIDYLYSDKMSSYFVTELLGTDLHRLLTSRPLEKQFIQYFLYQILVGESIKMHVRI
jgi:p38 MAP kinase